MGWRDDERAGRAALVEATRSVADEIRALGDKPREERGYRSDPAQPFQGITGLGLILRLCRDGDVSIATMFKRVPDTHVIPNGLEETMVSCLCGAQIPVSCTLEPCDGDCGRWMALDATGAVWSVRLPESDE